jgi:uncharacterized repeat protein (TIGR02543 family)
VKDAAGYQAQEGVVTGIKIGARVDISGLKGDPTAEISATIIDKDIISNTPEIDDNGTPDDPSDDTVLDITPPDGNDKNLDDPSDSARYVVAANNAEILYSDVADYVGDGQALSALIKGRLIGKAGAEAFKMLKGTGITGHVVDVVANGISANARPGDSFPVTFIAQGVPSVYVKVNFTVTRGNIPEITSSGPLVFDKSDTSQRLSLEALMTGISAYDAEDEDLTSEVEVTEPDSVERPLIDTSVAGVTSVKYSVEDSDGNEAVVYRAIVIDDGRFSLIDENNDDVYDLFIAAKNFVIKQVDVDGTIAQAKALSHVKAYDAEGKDITSQVKLNDADLPEDYCAKVAGPYDLTWTISEHPQALKNVTALIVLDTTLDGKEDYFIDPGANDWESTYAVIAHDFSVNLATAATITAEPAYLAYAGAHTISLVGDYTVSDAFLHDNGGFMAKQASYDVTFGSAPSGKGAALTIIARVDQWHAPEITFDEPIVIPWEEGNTGSFDLASILAAGHVEAKDAEDGDIDLFTEMATIDTATGITPDIPAGQHGVYQVKFMVVDSDGNEVEETIAVVVQDGNYVIDKGYILRAVDFEIPLTDVTASDPNAQIRSRGDVNAWKNDGTAVAASVNPAGYGNTPATYNPIVSIYDPGSSAPTIEIIQKVITATVFDNRTYYNVTFNANGGALTGPDTITVVDRTTLPYMPSSPVRSGYTFRYWGTAAGTQFTASTQLTGDITLYAFWEAIPAVAPPAPTPPPNVIVNNPPAVGGNTFVTVEPATGSGVVTVPDEETPLSGSQTQIPEGGTPQGSNEPLTGWSLFNLLAAILSLLLLVFLFVKFFWDRPRLEEYEEEPVDVQLWAAMSPEQRAQYQARCESDYQAWLVERQRYENRQRALVVNAPVLLIAVAAFVEALIVLFTTQDFSLNMIIVDNYSVFFALLVFVQLLTPMVAAIIRNSRRENQLGQTAPQATSGGGDVTL